MMRNMQWYKNTFAQKKAILVQEIAFFEKKVNFAITRGKINSCVTNSFFMWKLPFRFRIGPGKVVLWFQDHNSQMYIQMYIDPTYSALYWALLDTTCRAGMHAMEIGFV